MGEVLGFICGGVALLFFTVESFKSIIWSIQKIILGYRSKSWCPAESTVIACRILDDIGSIRTGPNYGIAFTYRYIVDGTAFTAQFEQRGFHSRKAVEYAENVTYALGSKREIFYRPNSPQEMVLRRGLRSSYFFDFAWAIVFFGMIVVTLMIFIFTLYLLLRK
ncbi:MAG: DUF3592 domain-containing protein [Alkalinema sp. RU_4_3]|nr:DUF3592 domain-containing protein [Alkalinema sp. RU_4_3]